MLKPVVQLAAIGIVGIGLWKLASVLLLPFLFFAFKVLLIVALVAGVVWFINKKGKTDTPPPVSD